MRQAHAIDQAPKTVAPAQRPTLRAGAATAEATPGEPAPRSAQAEHILDVATSLFARGGFEGVTTRQIAAAAGLNIATVHHHVGTKGALYRAVVQRLYDEERALVDHLLATAEELALDDAAALRALFSELAGTAVDLMDRSPLRARLYLRRWLEESPGADQPEARQLLALYGALDQLIARAQASGLVQPALDRALFLRSFDWLIYGYFVSGPIDWARWRGDPHAPGQVAAFKQYLDEYLVRMLGLEQAPRGGKG